MSQVLVVPPGCGQRDVPMWSFGGSKSPYDEPALGPGNQELLTQPCIRRNSPAVLSRTQRWVPNMLCGQSICTRAEGLAHVIV